MPADHRPVEPPALSRSVARLILRATVTFVVVGVVFGLVIPKLADYRAVLGIVGDVGPAGWAVLLLLAAAFLVAYPLVLVAVIPTLRLDEALVAQTTATAVNNAVPAGGAFSLPLQYAIYLSWGLSPEMVTSGLVAAGMFDQMARLVLPVVAVAGIALLGEAAGWMWTVAAVGTAAAGTMAVLLLLAVRSEEFARRVGGFLERLTTPLRRAVRRDPLDVTGTVLRFRRDLLAVIVHRWKAAVAATFLNHVAMAALFLAAIRAAGVARSEIAWPWVLLAFALGRLLVVVPVSPGGLGLVDLGYLGLLTLGWQVTNPTTPPDTDLLAAAVLLFRALSFLPPIPVGLGSWIVWRTEGTRRRERHRTRRRPRPPTTP